MYFVYGEKEIGHLQRRDRRLGAAIEQIGLVERAVDGDLFASVIHHIVGQQISTAAQETIWRRLREAVGPLTPQAVLAYGPEALQQCGMTHKKAGYIRHFAGRVADGHLDLSALGQKSDQEVIAELSALPGIGVWTAEMLLTFCLQRPDVFSYGDLGIHRGLRILYRHQTIDRERFERFRRRYSPHGTVASLYLWAISSGAIPDLTDPAPKKPRKKVTDRGGADKK